MKLSILFLAAAALTEAARRKTFAEGEMGMTGTNVATAETHATGATNAPSTTVTSAPVVNTPAGNDSAAGDDTAGTDTVAVQGGGSCPNVWKAISAELSWMFAGCNDDARAAIRSVFHDCFPSGGCDGSLAIPAELARKDNRGLVTYVNKIKALAKANKVTVADMISFAGCKNNLYPRRMLYSKLITHQHTPSSHVQVVQLSKRTLDEKTPQNPHQTANFPKPTLVAMKLSQNSNSEDSVLKISVLSLAHTAPADNSSPTLPKPEHQKTLPQASGISHTTKRRLHERHHFLSKAI